MLWRPRNWKEQSVQRSSGHPVVPNSSLYKELVQHLSFLSFVSFKMTGYSKRGLLFVDWSKVIFHQRLTSIVGSPPLEIIFHQRLIINLRLSLIIKGWLPFKVIIHQRSSFIKCCLPSKADQEKSLALLASWSFCRKPTAKCENSSIEKVLSIPKTGSKSSLSVLK